METNYHNKAIQQSENNKVVWFRDLIPPPKQLTKECKIVAEERAILRALMGVKRLPNGCRIMGEK